MANTELKTNLHLQDGALIVQEVQDVEPILKANNRQRNEDPGHYRDGDIHHLARIPLVMVMKLRKDENIDIFNMTIDEEKRLMKLLNSRDYAGLKVKPGQI